MSHSAFPLARAGRLSIAHVLNPRDEEPRPLFGWSRQLALQTDGNVFLPGTGTVIWVLDHDPIAAFGGGVLR